MSEKQTRGAKTVVFLSLVFFSYVVQLQIYFIFTAMWSHNFYSYFSQSGQIISDLRLQHQPLHGETER